MTLQTSPHLQNQRTLPRPNGMFDVDCSNIGIRCTPNANSITVVTPSKPVPTAKLKNVDQKPPYVQAYKTDPTHKNKQCEIPSTGPTGGVTHKNKQYEPPLVQSQYSQRKNDLQAQQTVKSVPNPHSIVLKRETLASMYIASMFIGFAVLGIVGGAASQQHVFLSFSLFYGVFIPVVILHGTSVIHRVWAAVPMMIYLIYAPVSVSLSIIHKSHIFLSVSLVMVGFCFVMAGVGGWIRIVSVVILTLFTSMCFGGALHSPDRGDVIALVVIPTFQIIYVCLAGVVSVVMIPVAGVENANNSTVYQDRLAQIL
jgi:hypothetical protein